MPVQTHKIVNRKPADLVPYERNARTHPPEQIEQIRASIREFGFTNPVLLRDDGKTIGAGHGRVTAAIAEGLKRIPTITLHGLTDAQWRAYVLADNQIALNSGWDDRLLKLEIAELQALEFDVGLIGFTPDRLAEIATFGVGDAGGKDPDAEAPEPPADAVSMPGDVWLLGKHRIRCGDSTNADDVAALLGEDKPHLMVTDPPYGVEYDPSWRAQAGVNKNTKKMGAVQNDARADWTETWQLFPGDVAYIWHGALHSAEVWRSLIASGFSIRSQIIWAKDRFALSRGHYHWHHEPAFYAVRESAHWAGDRKQSTLWNIPARDDSGHGHSTQKPVECMRRPMVNNSKPGDSVYDPFLGSGTSIIAAELTGRACLGMELNPPYVDVCVERWQAQTGLEARLQATGKTFAEVSAERKPQKRGRKPKQKPAEEIPAGENAGGGGAD